MAFIPLISRVPVEKAAAVISPPEQTSKAAPAPAPQHETPLTPPLSPMAKRLLRALDLDA
jgi:hypothetical protein